ncbi:MAG: peptide deformylase [Atribacterota bacterium]
MKLIKYPDSILRKVCKKIEDKEYEKIYQELIAAMISYGGIGLAAPQIGINKRIAVVSPNADSKMEKPLVLINPEIKNEQGKQSIEEGCLSLPGINASVPRADKIEVETGPDEQREILIADGLLSIVIQHEVDHLKGILFPDRLNSPKRLYYFLKARFKNK